MQRMGTYFYASPLGAEATRQAVLAFTHSDMYKPMRRLQDDGQSHAPDRQGQGPGRGLVRWLGRRHRTARGRSASISSATRNAATTSPVSPTTPQVMAKQSDKDFLITPWDEPVPTSAVTGTRSGRRVCCGAEPAPRVNRLPRPTRSMARSTTWVTPRRCSGYWTTRTAIGTTPTPAPRARPGIRTPSGTSPYVKNDRYLGVAYKMGMGIDLSEIRSVRVAVLRRDRHDEQHERGYGAPAEVHHRGHRLVRKEPGR